MDSSASTAFDEAHRRLAAGHDQEDDHAVELTLRKVVSLLLGLDERADEILRRVCAPLPEEVVEIRDELLGVDRELLLQLLGDRGHHEGVRPRAEAVLIFDGYAEELGDDRDRKREGVVVHEIHRPPLDDAVEELVRDLEDTRSELRDDSRRDRLRHESAQPTMVVAVLGEQVRVDPLVEGQRARRTNRSLSMSTATTSS